METLFEIFILRFGLRKRGEIRGVADSFSGGSPDLKKKTEKTEKNWKNWKIRFFAKYSKQKTMFFSFCIFKDTNFDLKNLKNLKKIWKKSEKYSEKFQLVHLRKESATPRLFLFCYFCWKKFPSSLRIFFNG